MSYQQRTPNLQSFGYDMPSMCRNGHPLNEQNFDVDRCSRCRHGTDYEIKGKYSCSKCSDCGPYVTLTKDLNCATCDREALLEQNRPPPPGPGYEFHVDGRKCNGHYVKVECCDFTCYDCKETGCCCYGIEHCCCHN